MLGLHEDFPRVFENILWSDKAMFRVGGFISRHNCYYWAAQDRNMTVEKLQNQPNTTVWCGMTATIVIGPYLLRDTMISLFNVQFQ
jgi:hypothetical protein